MFIYKKHFTNQPVTTADGKREGHVKDRRPVDKLKTGERDRLKNEDWPVNTERWWRKVDRDTRVGGDLSDTGSDQSKQDDLQSQN